MPVPIVSDFIFTYKVAVQLVDEVVNVKRSGARLTVADEHKFSIEKRYHEERGRVCRRYLSDGLNGNVARNYDWLYPVAERALKVGFTPREKQVQVLFVRELSEYRRSTVSDVCEAVTEAHSLGPGEAVRAFRELLATKQLVADMDVPSLVRQRTAEFILSKDLQTTIQSDISA